MLVRSFAGDVHGELVDEEARDRHTAVRVGLRGVEDQPAADLAHRFRDVGAPPEQVQVPYPQPGHLPEPDTGVREEQHS